MSLSLSPIDNLVFNRSASTHSLQIELTATNHNAHCVAFKISTTAPKMYCVKPNIAKMNPGESVSILIKMNAADSTFPLNVKNRGKFLIESALMEPQQESLAPRKVINTAEKNEVHRQKFRVHLPMELRTTAMDAPEKQEPGDQMPGETGPSRGNSCYIENDRHFRSPPPEYNEKSPETSVTFRPQQTRDTTPVNTLWRSISRLFRRPTASHAVQAQCAARPPLPEYYPITSANTTRTVSTVTYDHDLVVQLAEARAEVQMLRARLSALSEG